MGVTFVSASAEETKALAAALAPLVRPCDIILLNGDLGAGKTQFSQGFANALGVKQQVTSPTFTILLEYRDGRLPLYHFDLYRLEDDEELEDIGYFDVLEADGVSLVEWADKFPDSLPEDYLELRITIAPDETRFLAAMPEGSRSEELLADWEQALSCV